MAWGEFCKFFNSVNFDSRQNLLKNYVTLVTSFKNVWS